MSSFSEGVSRNATILVPDHPPLSSSCFCSVSTAEHRARRRIPSLPPGSRRSPKTAQGQSYGKTPQLSCPAGNTSPRAWRGWGKGRPVRSEVLLKESADRGSRPWRGSPSILPSLLPLPRSRIRLPIKARHHAAISTKPSWNSPRYKHLTPVSF